jgi:hypothetical protein
VKKGIYIDGYKRPDIVKYRNNVFIPLIALYERHMVQWKSKGVGLVHVKLDLRLEEKRVIAVFQNESCFHINDNKHTIWCTPCCQLHMALFPLTLE